MKRSNIRKWLLYLMTVFTVLFSFLFVVAGKSVAGYGEMDMVPAKITAPESVTSIDYSLPGNRISKGLDGTGSGVAAREEDGEGYRMYCFLIQVLSLLMFLHYICQVVIRQFDRYNTKLWYNILYIHRSDGKKKMAFCNE